MAEKVVILGGGVGGMSAAQELIERGFDVEILERQLIAGGKARSIPVMEGEDDHGSKERHIRALEEWLKIDGPSTPPGVKRPWLPGEHGFRFFPNFYRHITNTMSRIPYYDKGTVFDNLTHTTRVLVALYDKAGIVLPERFPRNLKELTNALQTFLYALSPRDEIAFEDIEHFAGCIWQLMTTCKERRFDEFERIGWWEFIGAENRSEAYQKFLAIGITRSLVAAKARTASTKTIGDIFLQLLFGIIAPEPYSNRLLNGPTNLVWIQPWLEYLEERGVVYHFDTTVTGIECKGGRITGVTALKDGQPFQVTGDWYIGALPVERIAPLITSEMTDIDPGLALLTPLARNVQWMNGIQFYLTRDVELTDGHVIFIDSSWALTAVSQKQFWSAVDLENWGDGKTKGVLSIDISEWDKPGMNGKTARECTRQEIADEVWAQLKRSMNVDGEELLDDKDLHYWFLDPDIVVDPNDPGRLENVEPLLVNRVNTWRLRPNAGTKIPNFCLASDYVRTFTDLATMEGANEAARRAVNSILDRSGSEATRCKIWDLHEPDALEPMRAYDKARYDAGLPWDDRLAVAVQASLKIAQSASATEYGGEGLLADMAPFTAEASKPDSPLSDPIIANALRMIGPPPGTISEIARHLPGMNAEIPGTEEFSGLVESIAGSDDTWDEQSHSDSAVDGVLGFSESKKEDLKKTSGENDDVDAVLPNTRISLTQIE
ncbi:MAG: hydroxysqualene dehydroxylase [Boseongicola sp.]